MVWTVSEIAEAMGAEFVGDGGLKITRLAEPSDAGPEDLAMAMQPTYAEALGQGRAQAAALWVGAGWQEMGLRAAIFVARPRLGMSKVTRLFEVPPHTHEGISALAHVDASARLGEGASVGPFVVIGPGAVIGPNARILSHASIGRDAVIGEDCLIHPGVRIGERVQIGARFVAQPGAVIGGDGFSFVTGDKSTVETVRETLSGDVRAGGDKPAADKASSDDQPVDRSWIRISSVGAVEIGDDVEVGANSSIDRGTIRATRIGSGTKIDSMVQVGHNVQVGRDCLLCGQVGIGGSTVIGDRCVLGGQAGLNDNITLGHDVVVGGGASVVSSVAPGKAVWGNPATRMDQAVENYKALRRLPRLFKQVAALQKRVSKIDPTE
ncbi:UDP-3-O-(3-hydroxymyristoyl)glucosamine N-acyltransferase [Brevirhabdus pacifica]|uniref:UDP-3-O-acylglucosamine N-acyltransferase n=1 Tax=Brevirhabdus pacifica TaxID=1267768 RepID=A0A1U7DFQ4_9RHOB|nr:UDP-3-O-(3-hydroxymyristoyl)glucosamine N-acyltransferase [Brevirhabdus pacifica]APX88729.1 UDP-3-O-(3-hydroxymyristoyl)glucosamine N-acyltransferase [Brevirhabdus pacifica]OWU79988.1 UDP-3-O-(3-hydroxymyristoyl) glucosamine N-acyltransferase [Loktanella sp. 22II-4b]PJJ86752.1 UDP-3-O-[3-hydroxymyristoyl] glucosamine N-acyltransferase [Brevirhabdus pacifica]